MQTGYCFPCFFRKPHLDKHQVSILFPSASMDLRRVDNASNDILTYPPHYVTCEYPYCSVFRPRVLRPATVKMSQAFPGAPRVIRNLWKIRREPYFECTRCKQPFPCKACPGSIMNLGRVHQHATVVKIIFI